jgi:hypothetical protein
MEAIATKFTWPLSTMRGSHAPVSPYVEYVVYATSNAGLWSITLTILTALIAYDQSESVVNRHAMLFLTWLIVHSRVPLEQGQHRRLDL